MVVVVHGLRKTGWCEVSAVMGWGAWAHALGLPSSRLEGCLGLVLWFERRRMDSFGGLFVYSVVAVRDAAIVPRCPCEHWLRD